MLPLNLCDGSELLMSLKHISNEGYSGFSCIVNSSFFFITSLFPLHVPVATLQDRNWTLLGEVVLCTPSNLQPLD